MRGRGKSEDSANGKRGGTRCILWAWEAQTQFICMYTSDYYFYGRCSLLPYSLSPLSLSYFLSPFSLPFLTLTCTKRLLFVHGNTGGASARVSCPIFVFSRINERRSDEITYIYSIVNWMICKGRKNRFESIIRSRRLVLVDSDRFFRVFGMNLREWREKRIWEILCSSRMLLVDKSILSEFDATWDQIFQPQGMKRKFKLMLCISLYY